MTKPKDFLFEMHPPGPEVQAFVDLHPDGIWKEALSFVLDRYPQIVNGEVRWLLDGGTVIHLQHPGRKTPKDVDILTKDDEMAQQFSPTFPHGMFDVKSLRLWLQLRNLSYDPQFDDRFFGTYQTLDFQGRRVHAVMPTILAAGKTHFWTKTMREKDKSDLEILGVSQDRVNRFIRGMPSIT